MAEKFKVKKDVWTSDKPNYYKVNQKQDLLDVYENGLLNKQQNIGFNLGVIFKYLFRFQKKGQAKADLMKALMYLVRLVNYVLGTDLYIARRHR